MPSSSRIEQIIEEMEEFLDSCKESFMNKSFIMVNKEQFEDLIRDLKASTPDEIKRYQKIIANKDAILADARNKAESLVADATEQTNELLSEHQIMLEAHSRADEIIRRSTEQAQNILDNATIEANQVKDMAMKYMDDVLAHLESLIKSATDSSIKSYNNLVSGLDQYKNIIESNRRELHPVEEEMEVIQAAVGAGEVYGEE